MCISKLELEKKVQDLRGLKTMKEEVDDEIRAIERQIIDYMTEHEIDTEVVPDAKITYKSQARKTLDRKRLEKDFGNLEDYEKVTQYSVLRVK